PPPMKSEAALRVATPLLEEPVADRRNWTIPRLRAEIEAREGVCISRSQLSKALRKKVPLAAAPAHAEGTPDGKRGATGGPAPATAQTAGRSGRHCSSLRRRERGADSSLSRPRLGEVGGGLARAGAGAGQEGRDAGVARSRHASTHRPYQPDQAQQRFHRPSRATRPSLWTAARATGQADRAGRGQWSDPHQQTFARRPGRPRTLAHRRMAAEIRARTQRHRAGLARPQGPSPRPPDQPPPSTRPSMTPSSISTASAAPIRWPGRESLLRMRGVTRTGDPLSRRADLR